MSAPRPHLGVLAALVYGLGAAWNGGNIGGVVTRLHLVFGVSITSVGLLSGTVFFAAVTVALLVANALAERVGLAQTLRISAASCCLGNVVFALSDGFGVLIAGRVIAGFAVDDAHEGERRDGVSREQPLPLDHRERER